MSYITNLQLSKINPSVHLKYSPNLYKYLRNRNKYHEENHVYKDKENTLWIGYPDEGYFIGAQFMNVLCCGVNAFAGAYYRIKDLQIIPDFWQKYIDKGRCAIDPGHEKFWKDVRWVYSIDGRTRECLWCKQAQNLKMGVKIVTTETWHNNRSVAK
jgi:hypothetical protein